MQESAGQHGRLRLLLAIAAAGEALTGLLLLAAPATVTRLLFGADVAGAGIVVSRVAGIALISLGAACWPTIGAVLGAARGMTCYSLLATIYLVAVGLGGATAGPLVWPAAALHAILTVLLILAWRSPGSQK